MSKAFGGIATISAAAAQKEEPQMTQKGTMASTACRLSIYAYGLASYIWTGHHGMHSPGGRYLSAPYTLEEKHAHDADLITSMMESPQQAAPG